MPLDSDLWHSQGLAPEEIPRSSRLLYARNHGYDECFGVVIQLGFTLNAVPMDDRRAVFGKPRRLCWRISHISDAEYVCYYIWVTNSMVMGEDNSSLTTIDRAERPRPPERGCKSGNEELWGGVIRLFPIVRNWGSEHHYGLFSPQG